MVKEYFKNFMLSRFHIFLFTISSIVMGVELYQYIFLSGENNGVSFLFNSNMSFLVFTNILYVFLIYRYYTYQRLRKFSVIRISKSKYCKFILKIELLIWFIFFVVVYLLFAYLIGIPQEHMHIYLAQLSFYVILNLSLISFQVYWFYKKSPIHICILISYLTMAIYNYYICNLIFRLF